MDVKHNVLVSATGTPHGRIPAVKVVLRDEDGSLAFFQFSLAEVEHIIRRLVRAYDTSWANAFLGPRRKRR